ncbi:hypothetical protein EIP91_003315 [Steccherinum ochraceum]|uniref:Uncharacterized protein n=1 Tax=Steccherinum ochraceum TaxID=92696 RepID=A0A4R0RDA8_9APHY|nr:hypothetical protein EIP91_003315 [Steccherinum ochraceum]
MSVHSGHLEIVLSESRANTVRSYDSLAKSEEGHVSRPPSFPTAVASNNSTVHTNASRRIPLAKFDDAVADLAKEQTDLLLDLAVTTAYSSLLDGTPISDWESLGSFISVFVLIWWVWASQVLYHARFRERDWVHVILYFVFQLAVFMAFTAFTNNFDVADGITQPGISNDDALDGLRQQAGWFPLAIKAQDSLEGRISGRNMRGISMTMALSRVMLLVEYMCSIRRIRERLEQTPDATDGDKQKAVALQRQELWVYCGALVVSITCYLLSFFLLGKHPSPKTEVARICLWYPPILLEILVQYIVTNLAAHHSREFGDPNNTHQANDLQNNLWRYNATAVHLRRTVIFSVILGVGLDKLTNQFRFLIGNVAFGPHRFFTIFCAGLTIILLFTLHYTNLKIAEDIRREERATRRLRVLTSFLFNFFYLCALVVTIQGMIALFQIGNVGDLLQGALGFMHDTDVQLNATHFGIPLDPANYGTPVTEKLLKAGFPVETLVAGINNYIPSPFSNDMEYPFKAALFYSVVVISAGLRGINLIPQDDSLASNSITAFLESATTTRLPTLNNTVISDFTKERFLNVTTLALTDSTAAPATWFTAAGGLVLVVLAVIETLDHWLTIQDLFPMWLRCKCSQTKKESLTSDTRPPMSTSWSTFSVLHTARHCFVNLKDRRMKRAVQICYHISSKLLCGLVLIGLTALGNHGSDVELDNDYSFDGSRIWRLAIHSWLDASSMWIGIGLLAAAFGCERV